MLKKLKNKVNLAITALYTGYKRSSGPIDFLKKAYRFVKRAKSNGFAVSVNIAKTEYNEIVQLEHSVDSVVLQRFNNLLPLPIFISSESNLRLNIITDSLEEHSLYGGTITSIIFAMLLANKLNCSLRVITRDKHSKASTLLDIAKINNIKVPCDYEICNFPYYLGEEIDNFRLAISKNDIFIATSWWTATVVKNINMRKKYIYIVQEYEKIFYPYGDEHVMIDAVFSDVNMIPIVNTNFLHQYFINHNYYHISEQGLCFEPAFVGGKIFPRKKYKSQDKFNLFFYSRSNIPRNLYYTGLNLINSAINIGIINTKEWNIFFAGGNSQLPIFSDGTKPINFAKLSWDKYWKFISTVDLGISLMLAPCPSYPPLDLASVGAVALTNQFKNKLNLTDYSKNIICSELHDDLLLRNLDIAINLAKDSEKRQSNFLLNNINDDWQRSFSPIMDQLCERVEKNLL